MLVLIGLLNKKHEDSGSAINTLRFIRFIQKCLTILEMIRFGLGKNHGKNIINTTGEHGGWKTIKHGI